MNGLSLTALLRWGTAVLLGFVALQEPAWAKLGSDESWQEASPDGQYLLVMIPEWKHRAPPDRIKALRAIHPRNGVYRNDASHELLWGIDGYCIAGFACYFAPDGQQVVIRNDYSLDGLQITLLSAEREPKCLDLYKCVPFFRLKRLLSYGFLEVREDHFDPTALTYTVWTSMGERYVFDVRTGTLRDASSPWHRCAVGLLACLAAIGAIVAWLLVRRSQDRKRKAGSL